tara:strand:- start:6139 stop:6429 length:291 start_codon:yes stop_codon:yes gene_type:complete
MNKKILEKLDLVLEDLKMLKAGTWKPDDESCDASISNIEDVISELTISFRPLESDIKNNIEWLYTTTEDEVQCIGIENLESILQEYINESFSISLE